MTGGLKRREYFAKRQIYILENDVYRSGKRHKEESGLQEVCPYQIGRAHV
jgi:hypothetical protein